MSKSTRFYSKTVFVYGFCYFLSGTVLSLFGLCSEATATTLTLDYTISFGALAPDGPAPYASSTFDDGGGLGTVTLTVEVAPTVGIADVTALYFNLDPSLDPNSLSIVRTGGTGPAAGDIDIFTGVDSFMADGDGMYDILIDLPPPPGGDRFEAGETLIFSIDGIATLGASSFDFNAAPGGGAGPFLSVARFQSTGATGEESDWVGAVPEPATLVLLAIGSVASIGVRKRRDRMQG